MSRRARATVLASLALTALAVAGAAHATTAFEIRDRDLEISQRTLEIVRTAERPPSKIWVYFTDKNVFDESTARARLSEVRDALSPRGALRRSKVIDGLVDYYDIPVHRAYVERLEALGADVRRESRWLNAVSIVAPLDVMEQIVALDFVAKLTPVAGASKLYPAAESATATEGALGATSRGLDYGASQAQIEQINVNGAHDLGLSGNGVRIATLDTGFMHTHSTFSTIIAENRLIAQYDFVNDDSQTMNQAGDPSSSHNHGTLTWSAMGGYTPGELIGPAYGAEFLLAKTEDVGSETPVEEDNWCAAAEWADMNGADIITSSLGYIDWYTYEDMDGQTAAITLCADLAFSRGIVVVTSAGNEGNSSWFYITAPADAFNIISVGAVDASNIIATFSSHGPTFDDRTKPEVVARGVSTHAASASGGYSDPSGTSLACPLVAGACALILEQHPEWTPDQVRTVLLETADTADSPNNSRGWGLIDVVAAMNAPVAADDFPGAVPPTPAKLRLFAAPNPLGGRTVLSLGLAAQTGGDLEIFDVAGRRVRRYAVAPGAGSVVWDSRDAGGRLVAPGIYVARLTNGTGATDLKLVVDR